MEYKRIRLDAKCLHCIGCQQLENPNFRGLTTCNSFRQCSKEAWCANETIEHWNRTGKIKR